MSSKSVFIFTWLFVLFFLFVPVLSQECVWPEQKCVGNDKYQCNMFGEWEYFSTCPPGTICTKQSPTSDYVVCESNRYLINEGESMLFNGKTISLAGVSDYDTVVVDVDGTAKVINKDETKTFDGLSIKVVDVYYLPREGEISSALLEISKTSVNQTCTDSDGGINYYVKGCVTVCTYTDTGGSCGSSCDACVGTELTEGYCKNNEGKTVKYQCPYGCENGACLQQGQTTTTTTTSTTTTTIPVICGDNICNGKETCYSCPQDCNNKCATNKPAYCIDGNSVSRCDLCGCPEGYDTCLDSGCCNKKICSDSDDGLNYYVKGNVSSGSETICALGGSGGAGSPINDTCSGNILRERYCDENNNSKYLDYTCPYGCENGACLQQGQTTTTTITSTTTIPTTTTTVPICSGNVYLSLSPNPVQMSSDVHVTISGTDCSNYVFAKDSCYEVNPCLGMSCGAAPGKDVYCKCQFTSPDTIGSYTYYACIDKNKDGDYDDTGESDSEILSVVRKTCEDSDNGIDYYTKGTVVVCTYTESDLGGGGSCGAAEDSCADNFLTEGYCENNERKAVKYQCPYGCEDGACIRQTITTVPSSNTCQGQGGRCMMGSGGCNTYCRSRGGFGLCEPNYPGCHPSDCCCLCAGGMSITDSIIQFFKNLFGLR